MRQPEILFAYRKAFYEDQWHLRCICCGMYSEEVWEWPRIWQYQFSSGLPVSLDFPRREDTSHIPSGPFEVHGKDPIIEAMSSPRAILALVSQNEIVAYSGGDLSQLSLPQFISREICSTVKHEFRVDFEIPFLDDLPDVQIYEKDMYEKSKGDPDLMMSLAKAPTKTQIPAQLFMPAEIEINGRVIPCVYFIHEWLTETEAQIECYTSESIHAGQQSALLIRQFRDYDNKLIKRILGKIQWQ